MELAHKVNEAMRRTKGGLNTQLHLAVDGHGRPLSAIIRQGTVAAAAWLAGFTAEYLLADRSYPMIPMVL